MDVSIIIPVYNTEKYLQKAIDSCINQSFKNLEIIIINDGSTDNSLRIAQEYEARHNFVRVITTENKGLSEARNKGLEVAYGKYIYFLDADDRIENQTIELCYKVAIENELDMVLFDSKVDVEGSMESLVSIRDDYCKRDHIVDPNTIYTGRQFIEAYANKRGAFVQAWLVFTKRDFLLENKIRFLPKAYYEDVAFHYSCMMMAERIMYIPQAFHVRLYRDGSIMTSSLNVRKICSVYEITKEMYSSLLIYGKQNDNLWTEYFIHLTRYLFRTVLTKVSRKDIVAAKTHDKEIIELQRAVINMYYNIALMSEKVSNVNRTLDYIEEIITPFGWLSKEFIDVAKELVVERDNLIYKILSRLPLKEENKKIGVYGSGKHAEYILNKYIEMLGDIKADLIFIDSHKVSFTEKYNGYDIINIDDLQTIDISEIVILSYFYEEDMYNNVLARYGNSYPIYRIYNGEKEPLDSTAHMERYISLQKHFEQGRLKRVVLINTPLHSNIGDHMIAHATKNFFKDYLPDYEVIEVTNKMYKENKNEVIYRTNVDDIIVITGGGFLGSLWPYSGQNVYDIIQAFPDNKIIILPQSLYFEDTEEGNRQKQLAFDLFTKHNNLTVCYRESISYDRSETLFEGKVKSYLMPDMVLTLNYSKEQEARDGLLLCLRSDKEGMLSEDDKLTIKNHFLKLGEHMDETSMHYHSEIRPNQRESVINLKIKEFKKYKLVITDALHCMISCAISGTPCIPINNLNRKLEGIYKSWLNDLKYIRFVNSYEEILYMNLNNWEELHKNNYYNKDYSQFLSQIANIVRD